MYINGMCIFGEHREKHKDPGKKMKYDLRQLPIDRVLVSPSLLAADFGNLDRDIEMLNESCCDWIHLSLMPLWQRQKN